MSLFAAKFIQVDIFGQCGQSTSCNGQNWECEYEILRPYKFLLTLENSICKDYITEKTLVRMRNYIVPIVSRYEEYSKVLRKNSFIAIDQFNSTEELANYLHYLNRNPAEYKKYHAWRHEYRVGMDACDICVCRLCRFAQEDHSVTTIPNFSQWWFGEANCQRNYHNFVPKLVRRKN